MNTAVKEVQVIKATITGEKTEKIRVAAYCRVSTDKDDQLNSFFAQMRYYRDYVRGNDRMVLVDIYADEGITGTELEKRDEMKRLIRDCKHKKIDRVLVKSVTRFARNSLECIETIRTMQSCGVSVLFENDHIDTETMNSEMMLYIKSAFAQSEATSASKRMSTSIRMKMEDGTYVATSAPFGYELVDGELVVVPEEAEVVRKIFALYLQGYGINVIAKTIRDTDGDKRDWNRQGIKYILTNEKYIGDTMWQKSFTPAVLPLRNRPNRGELPKYYCEGTQEAIVSKEDFIAVKNLMREREEKHYKQYRNEKKLFYINVDTEDALFALLSTCQTIQMALLRDKILLRGGVARGTLFREDSIIFGKGLTQAYLLESNVASFPRIVFNRELLDDGNVYNSAVPQSIWESMLISRDEDELFYINPVTLLRSIQLFGGQEKVPEYFNCVLDSCQKELDTSYELSIRQKYQWLKSKVICEIKKNRQYILDHCQGNSLLQKWNI